MSGFQRYGLATISCGVALAAAWPLDTPSSCFFLAVMVSSLYGGKGPGLLSVGLSALAFDYFFVPPRFSLHIDQSSSYLRLAIFLGATLLITGLIEAKRRVEATTLANGPQVPQFDPVISGVVGAQHLTTQEYDPLQTGSNWLSQNTVSANAGVNAGFSSGAQVGINFNNNRNTTNAIGYTYNPFVTSSLGVTITQRCCKDLART